MMQKISARKKKFLLFDLFLFIVLVLLDQFTKYLAVIKLKDKPAVPILKNILELNYLENKGAAFGMLQNQKIFFVLIAVMIMVIIAYVLFLMPDDKKYNMMHVLLIMV